MDRREEPEVVDLGTASVETKGSDLDQLEGAGLRKIVTGISDD